MTSLSLDGSTRFIGTDFIKLEITGSSNLATEQYVLDQVAEGGNNVDLTNYYTKTETDGLLNTKYDTTTVDTLLDGKLNINNPQDVSGTLRIGHIAGTSKIILNAVSSDKDFYVNGDAQVGGNHLVNSLDSSNYIKGTSFISNTNNADNLNDILFQSNSVSYATFDVSDDNFKFLKGVQTSSNITSTAEINSVILKSNFIGNKDALTDSKVQINSSDFMTFNIANNNIEVDRDIEMHSSRLKSNIIDTWGNSDLEIKRNNVNFLELKTDNRIIANQLLQCGGNLKTQEIDTIALLDMVLKVNGVSKMSIGENLTVMNDDVVVGSGSQNGTDTLTVNGTAYVSGNAAVNGYLYITPNGYISNSSAPTAGRVQNFVVLGNAGTSLYNFYIGNASNLRVQFAYNDCYFTPLLL